MIKVNNLKKSFGKNVVLKDINFTIEDGKLYGFIGPNGAGKTTTLKIITGALNSDEGSVVIDNYDLDKEPLAAKKQFGYVADDPNLFIRLKGIEYLDFISNVYEVDFKTKQKKITDLAKTFNMEDALLDPISSYSRGMKQKIMVMGVLLHNPKNWILDEPLTGLDPNASFTLKEIMKERVKQGNTVLFSTHVLEVAEKLCDEVIIINNGIIFYKGTLEVLKESYPQLSLEEIFMKVTAHE